MKIVLMLATAVFLLCDAAFADPLTLPPPIFFSEAGSILPASPESFYNFDTGTVSNVAGTIGSSLCEYDYLGPCLETVTTSYSTGQASANGSGSGGGYGMAYGEVDFSFIVAGPSGPVPLVFNGSVSASASGVNAGAVAYTGFPGGFQEASVCSYCSPSSSHLGGSDPFSVPANSLSTITTEVFGYAFLGDWSATVDPSITFAPGFDSSAYTLEFSPSPASSVPEPSSLLLLGSGIVGAMGLMRRKLTH